MPAPGLSLKVSATHLATAQFALARGRTCAPPGLPVGGRPPISGSAPGSMVSTASRARSPNGVSSASVSDLGMAAAIRPIEPGATW